MALTPATRTRSLVAVIGSMAVHTLVYGFSYPLLALVLEARGASSTFIGLSSSVQAGAVFVVAPFAARAISALGPARVMRVCVVLSAALFALLPFAHEHAWFALRLLLGAAASLQWIAGETWVNHLAEDRVRGRVVGAYTMAISTGFALGPFVLGQVGAGGTAPFVLAAGLALLAAAPLALAPAVAAELSGRSARRPWALLAAAPVPMLTNFAFAASSGVLLTFFPLYGLALGLAEPRALELITLMALGGLALQVPAGWLADRVDRRLVLSACVLGSLLATLAMPLALAAQAWHWAYAFLYGAFRGTLYSLAVVLLGERFRGADLAAASTLFGVMWGSGMMLGPALGGVLVERFAPHGVPLAVALILAALLPLPVASWLAFRRRSARAP